MTPHYLLETAWKAEFVHGSGGRTVGINSEMDALPGIGHACGHNLIAISGLAVACAVRTVMQELSISGKIVLLGTPGKATCNGSKPHKTDHRAAEEGGYGKVRLLRKGAYNGMDVCLMCVALRVYSDSLSELTLRPDRCHPAPGPPLSASLSSTLAISQLTVEYHGQTYV